jgi:hypothetical protein
MCEVKVEDMLRAQRQGTRKEWGNGSKEEGMRYEKMEN